MLKACYTTENVLRMLREGKKRVNENKLFNLEKYLADGVAHFVRGAVKATLKNPKESIFLARYAAAAARADTRRHALEEKGEHIPSFLIASVASACNLQCVGCYAHANQGGAPALSGDDWARVFAEAEELGVAMILLAGGEPLLRPDVLQAAAARPNIAFPVFTNGLLVDDAVLRLLDANRNLVPIVSIEGDAAATDARRGAGVYAKTEAAMENMRKGGLLFGASITVTMENLNAVTQDSFVAQLRNKGCRVVLYVSYVPVDERDIALSPEGQARLDERVRVLRQADSDVIIVSFPGDEAEAEGCLAAGRGFIHINPAGGAEPCPFSPYSDTNVRDAGLRAALKSPLFARLNESGLLGQEHTGGCVLFYRQSEVQQLLGNEA